VNYLEKREGRKKTLCLLQAPSSEKGARSERKLERGIGLNSNFDMGVGRELGGIEETQLIREEKRD